MALSPHDVAHRLIGWNWPDTPRRRVLVALLALLLLPWVTGAQTYRVDPFTVDAGGGVSSDARYRVVGTVGQSEAGTLRAQLFGVRGGFWGTPEVVRLLPPYAGPGVVTPVTNRVVWDGPVASYTVEDQVPAGWTVSAISHSGTFDAANRRVKWGPFTDRALRLLSYNITPPAGTATVGVFSGSAVLGSDRLQITGRQTLPVLPHAPGAVVVAGELLVFGNYLAGTPTNDVLRLGPGITVTNNGVNWGSFPNPTRIAVFGQAGNDNLQVADTVLQSVELYGGPGDDTFKGSGGDDLIFGEDGKDFVLTSPGFDIFSGGAGQDGVVFEGTEGDDDISVHWYLVPDGQDPRVVVHPPFPRHRDALRVIVNNIAYEMDYTPQDDFETIVVFGHGGNDRIVMADDAAAQHWNAEFYGEEGDDVLIGSRNLSDKPRGNDYLSGGPGDDQLYGNSGHDLLEGGPGHDLIDSGLGVNRVLTDGDDDLVLNVRDTVDLLRVIPGVVRASIDWGDGVVEAGVVDAAVGEVKGSHAYDLLFAGPVVIVLTTVDADEVASTHRINAVVQRLPTTRSPEALALQPQATGAFSLNFSGIPGFTYVIEATDDLTLGEWQEVATLVCDLNGTVDFDHASAQEAGQLFYRAMALEDRLRESAATARAVDPFCGVPSASGLSPYSWKSAGAFPLGTSN